MQDKTERFGARLAALVLPITTIQNLISASAGAADVFMLLINAYYDWQNGKYHRDRGDILCRRRLLLRPH
jgi:hypothetical protein